MNACTRREFLRLTALTGVTTIAAACVPVAPEAPPQPTTVPAEAPPEPISKYKEAPELASLVQEGTLPPVDDRLPVDPCVVPVLEQTGRYGGTWRRGFKGVSDRWGPTKLIDGSFLWYNADVTLRANLASSWETNEDGTVWTWHLRQGVKWSDGEPFGSADCRWYYDNVLLNDALTPVTPTNWSTGSPKKLMQLDTPDDHTAIMSFADPYPLFDYTNCKSKPYAPGHYLKQFHMDITDDKESLAAEVDSANFDTWEAYYQSQTEWYMNPDLPKLTPWKAQNTMASELFVMDRNPYYFGVDEDGQQLPYIDRIHHRLYESPEVLTMRIVNGEIDLQGRHVTAANYTLYKESAEAGDYQVMYMNKANVINLNTNMTTKDPYVREFLQDRNVRFALNHAVNRDEINDLIFNDLGTPQQCAPPPQSPLYDADLANAYLDYDPERANALLDEAGYTERDAEGYRLWKDGSDAVGFVVEYILQADADLLSMCASYFADIGVRMDYKYVERSLQEEHNNANEYQANMWFGVALLLPFLNQTDYQGVYYARAWYLWYLDPSDPNAEEPPEGHWFRAIWDNWHQILVEPDEEKRIGLWRGITSIWKEELPLSGLIGQIKSPIIVKNGLRNFVNGLPWENWTSNTNVANNQTLFWDEPEQHV